MGALIKVACVQMTSGPDVQDNMAKAGALIKEAAAQGATFVLTPENTDRIRSTQSQKIDSAYSLDDHPAIPYFAALAKDLGITLLIGSMAVRVSEDKLLNRSFLFTADGSLQKTYDKIHLFDVQLPTGEKHTESDVVQPGTQAVTAAIGEGFSLGMTICYDLRFAYLYRDLAQAGANILCIPAAFTVPTGKAHWEILMRARAIETGSYVLAPAQVGEHEGGRKTYGHSLIIDPWGRVLAQKEEGEGIIFADLDLVEVERARGAIPALTHDRAYEVTANNE
mgnify:CR=1 FL=1|tara:strand:- start:10203 stop:11042 length:840 start_codon:yes stop_codon:yes gene_type:complete